MIKKEHSFNKKNVMNKYNKIKKKILINKKENNPIDWFK